MKRVPKEILVLIAIFLAGMSYVLWYVHDAKAKQRREAEAVEQGRP
ncbi:hypothetical protein [Synoicihabitans lomoniglobus]|uniref:Uncharacterized protein n=1 Tax=Synoicihabitans lomoniglobus TaxID=2909285 RepID=A0AAE9ZWB7_9BACT|nr:hypothetical protein [Opitutaceae bacterium LMO-M01]WED64289.1 hypothetical protein PXH66_18280 [Opitutaceae bacterium LMO-M01]